MDVNNKHQQEKTVASSLVATQYLVRVQACSFVLDNINNEIESDRIQYHGLVPGTRYQVPGTRYLVHGKGVSHFPSRQRQRVL